MRFVEQMKKIRSIEYPQSHSATRTQSPAHHASSTTLRSRSHGSNGYRNQQTLNYAPAGSYSDYQCDTANMQQKLRPLSSLNGGLNRTTLAFSIQSPTINNRPEPSLRNRLNELNDLLSTQKRAPDSRNQRIQQEHATQKTVEDNFKSPSYAYVDNNHSK